MKLKQLVLTAMLGASMTTSAMANEVLTGDTRLSCEAILCLASGKRPDECTPSLKRYYGISRKKQSDTIRDRIEFLRRCPVASETPEMAALVEAMGEGAGRCDAISLNFSLSHWNAKKEVRTVSNQMPSYCKAYTDNAYTNLSSVNPVYVGIPERGGFWVEPDRYQQALTEYNARIKAEDEAYFRSMQGK